MAEVCRCGVWREDHIHIRGADRSATEPVCSMPTADREAALERRIDDLVWAATHMDDGDVKSRMRAYGIVADGLDWVDAFHRARRYPELYERPA